LPAKALAEIAGVPMVVRVWRQASQAKSLLSVVVATDDERIAAPVRAAGGTVVMTKTTHQSGTDRIAEVAEQMLADVYLNVQGDLPFIAPEDLEALAVAGSIWTRMTVDTLTPIGALKNLRYLNLTNLKARDESLEPLSDLQSLEALDLANFYPAAQFARLAAKLKNTHCTWFDAVIPLTGFKCRKCGRETVVMLTGKGKSPLCSRCDESRVKGHEEIFRSLTANAS
jgi:molybdopterin-guanine dinucleotide biosynthesis protein A